MFVFSTMQYRRLSEAEELIASLQIALAKANNSNSGTKFSQYISMKKSASMKLSGISKATQTIPSE